MIKIFGKELFKRRDPLERLLGEVRESESKNKFLPDFRTNGGNFIEDDEYFISTEEAANLVNALKKEKEREKKRKGKRGRPVKEMRIEITPKGLHELKWLNEGNFGFNTDPKYIEQQIKDVTEKIDLVKTNNDMRRGIRELQSFLIRLENRKKYPQFAKFYENYPYTKSTKIAEVIKANPHLKLGQSEQFVASFPKEAITEMKKYKTETYKLCKKFPVFYVIAKTEDFRRTEKRKDPILLAQSPFGHFWQILGAWDEEMVLLEEL